MKNFTSKKKRFHTLYSLSLNRQQSSLAGAWNIASRAAQKRVGTQSILL